MAFREVGLKGPYPQDISILEGDLACYDTIGDPSFDIDRDELLYNRSRLEFIRDQLSEAQQAELDVVDAYWRDHAQEFNADFAVFHIRVKKATAMEGWVEDEDGNAPPIPRSHWWWKPIQEKD